MDNLNNEVFKHLDKLPSILDGWARISCLDEYWKPWEILRPWFEEHGYYLFYIAEDPASMPLAAGKGVYIPPAADSFGLYGERENLITTFFGQGAVFAARDRQNRDVVIKVISKGNEGLRELEILRFLNTEPIRSDPRNTTVRVLEFLTYGDWVFAIMPHCDLCSFPPFFNVLECLEFSEQVLAGLAFLHQHRIAHLDISHENIVMNHHGYLPYQDYNRFRTDFPICYWFIDFGFSYKFSLDAKLSNCRVQPRTMGREHRAPEVDEVLPYDPFAADVYQTSRFFYAWFQNVVPEIPGFLEILQDMSSVHPPDRISATSAWDRMHVLRIGVLNQNSLCEKLARPHKVAMTSYAHIPRSSLRMFAEWSRKYLNSLWQRFWFCFGIVM